MPFTTTFFSPCGCIRLWRIDTFPAYITEESNRTPNSDGYIVYTTENNLTLIPQDDMSDAVKLSEIADAPELNAMAYFIGVQDNGDDTFTDYKFTPAQMIDYISSQLSKLITSDSDTDSLTNAWFGGKIITEITTGGQTYLLNESFTQSGGTITWINGLSFYNAQIINAKTGT